MTTIESHRDSKLTWFNVLGISSYVLDLALIIVIAYGGLYGVFALAFGVPAPTLLVHAQMQVQSSGDTVTHEVVNFYAGTLLLGACVIGLIGWVLHRVFHRQVDGVTISLSACLGMVSAVVTFLVLAPRAAIVFMLLVSGAREATRIVRRRLLRRIWPDEVQTA